MSAALKMQLRSAVAELDASLLSIKRKLEQEHPGQNPVLIRDTTGRYLLLDGMAARANALAALAQLHS